MAIHPTAIIDAQAQLADDVEIGPYVILTGTVSIGPRCKIEAHAQLYGHTTLGEDNVIGPGAIIGALPQDTGFDPNTISHVRIGNANIVREYATIHRSATEGGATVLGNNNFLMVGAHVGHDSQLGDHNVLANDCLLGGHVTIGNHVFLGGGIGLHQFLRVGDRSIVAGGARTSQDVPPFVIAHENNRIRGLNTIGLRRAGFSSDVRQELASIFKIFYREERPLQEAIGEAEQQSWGVEAQEFLTFFKTESRKGVCRRMGS